MRHVPVLGVALLVVVGFAVPARATATARDWSLIFIRAGAHGATGVMVSDWHHVQTVAPVSSSGFGFADPSRRVGFGEVLPETGPAVNLSTTRGLAGEQVTFVRGPSTGELGVSPCIFEMRPHELAVALVFIAGGHFTTPDLLTSHTKTGNVTVETESGSGSAQWLLADQADGGLGVGASAQAAALQVGGGVGLGVSHSSTQSSGIVGSLVWAREVGVQQWNWHAPDGHSATASATTTPAVATAMGIMFAGPSGHWSWQWIGAMADTKATVLAAWAPVGRYWKLFAQSRASD